MILALIAALSLSAAPQKPDCNAVAKQAEEKCAENCAKKAKRQYQNNNKLKPPPQGAPSCEAACAERVAQAKELCKSTFNRAGGGGGGGSPAAAHGGEP
jgi:hypothetical protein